MMKKKSRIPKFNNYTEEAEFWDTHDVTDFLDELTPVKLIYKPAKKEELVAVRVETKLKKRVGDIADRWGLSPSSLVRMWIVEHVRAFDNKAEPAVVKKSTRSSK